MSSIKSIGLLLVFGCLLSACGQDSISIDFKQAAYPSILTEVSGMSVHEDWGRWSDGPVAKFRFNQPLPRKFTLLINAGAYGPNLDQPIIVRAGNVEKEFTVPSVATTFLRSTAFTLNFEGVDNTDTLEIIPPKPTRPKDINPGNIDARSLGVAIISLQFK